MKSICPSEGYIFFDIRFVPNHRILYKEYGTVRKTFFGDVILQLFDLSVVSIKV